MPAKKQKTRRTFIRGSQPENQDDLSEKQDREPQPQIEEEIAETKEETPEVEPETSDEEIEEQTLHSFRQEVLGDEKNEKPPKKPFVSKSGVLYFLAFFLIGVALATAGYVYFQYQSGQKSMSDVSAQGVREAEVLIKEVSRLIVLPTSEEPTVETVSEGSALHDRFSFENAMQGDKVLIYTQTNKAYLYRPSLGKLIDVSPVTPQTQNGAEETASEEVKVVLLNGSGVTGITRTAEATLTSELDTITILARENANSRDYAETVVVDLVGGNANAVESIVETLGVGEEGELPEEEERPSDADVLVILGADYQE